MRNLFLKLKNIHWNYFEIENGKGSDGAGGAPSNTERTSLIKTEMYQPFSGVILLQAIHRYQWTVGVQWGTNCLFLFLAPAAKIEHLVFFYTYGVPLKVYTSLLTWIQQCNSACDKCLASYTLCCPHGERPQLPYPAPSHSSCSALFWQFS